jgi:hypothetical protein
MNFHKKIILILLFTTSIVFSQKQLKYNFSIDKNTKELVIAKIKSDLGNLSYIKKNRTFWVEKTDNYEYRVSIKKRKINIFYKGDDILVEKKIKSLYSKIKKIN